MNGLCVCLIMFLDVPDSLVDRMLLTAILKVVFFTPHLYPFTSLIRKKEKPVFPRKKKSKSDFCQ